VKTKKNRTATLKTMKYMVKRGHLACFRTGFTMVELLIATVVLILILGITATMYKSASDAMEQTNSAVELQQTADAIKCQIEQDLASVIKDGYFILVRKQYNDLTESDLSGKIKYRNLTGYSDQIVFWRTGNFQSLVNPSVYSNLSIVYYNHAIIQPPIRVGVNASDQSNVNQWVLAKYNYLYVPYHLPSHSPDDYLPDTNLGRVIENSLLQAQVSQWVRPIASYKYTISNTDHYRRILSNTCGSFRIRYLLPTEDANHNRVLDLVGNENDGYASWPPDNEVNTLDQNIWLDLPNPGTYSSPGGTFGGLTNTWGEPVGIVCFYPGGNLWPKALEFTIRLYDRNLTVSSEDDSQTGANNPNRIRHGGATYKFIVRLPE
jgi:competence protein ComGC